MLILTNKDSTTSVVFGLMRFLKAFALIVVAMVGAFIFWKLDVAVGMPVLLFVVSLAIVGAENRLLWAAIFPVLCALFAAAASGVYEVLPSKPELPRLLLMFTLVSVIPGIILWMATEFRRRRLKESSRI